MKIKDQTITALDRLTPAQLMIVYDFILTIDKAGREGRPQGPARPSLRARRALEGCKGSLSTDVSLNRDDRI